MGSRQGRQARQVLKRRSLIRPLVIQFLVQAKRPPPPPRNLIILNAFNLCALCALCANLFPFPAMCALLPL